MDAFHYFQQYGEWAMQREEKDITLVSNYPAHTYMQNSTKVKTIFASKFNFCFAASGQLHN